MMPSELDYAIDNDSNMDDAACLQLLVAAHNKVNYGLV
jgi:hypothetical protein